MRYTSNHSSAVRFIAARKPFTGNSMYGATTPGYSVGRLSRDWQTVYFATANQIDYVVYSFATPIAWHLRNGLWIIPSTTYSGYTSRHQAYARRVAMEENLWSERIECDRFYTASEIMTLVREFDEAGSVSIHHNARQPAYVTIRGVKPGDYLQSPEDGQWLTVYWTERRRGVAGLRYWVAICQRKNGARETIYIGDANERITRVR